jgi:hypothetical protein
MVGPPTGAEPLSGIEVVGLDPEADADLEATPAMLDQSSGVASAGVAVQSGTADMDMADMPWYRRLFCNACGTKEGMTSVTQTITVQSVPASGGGLQSPNFTLSTGR